MPKIKLLVVGAGGHGRSVAEAAELCGAFEILGFLDDSVPVGDLILGYPVLGSVASLTDHRNLFDQAIVAIGNNKVREGLMQKLSDDAMTIATVIHPKAFVSPRAVIGSGSAIMAGAIVGTEAQVGMGSIVNCGAIVDHHAQVKDFGHLGVNACMAGGSVLGRGAWMQAGSSLGYGIVIPDGTTMRAGEAVDEKTSKYKQ
jgi:sugar O-acyltransferase (sialic acid O-acetyltransferase NeuD family)